MAENKRVRIIDGGQIKVASRKSLSSVQSSITCNGGLPRPKSPSQG
jgi:hypothetical protein